MRHLGLFEGIGGFSLAARWMGWETVAWCEINPFCQRVLKYHFPHAEGLTDIKETDFRKYANTIDILTGGFPCQPYSTAGKRKGKEDDRHLWPEMLRAIREIQPRWVLGENVRGLTNWNGGMVFDEVQADLETEGYQILPFLLPACAVNAPHRRDRIWFVGYSERCGSHGAWRGSGAQLKNGYSQLQKLIATDTTDSGRIGEGSGPSIEAGREQGPEPAGKLEGRLKRLRSDGADTDTGDTGLQRGPNNGSLNGSRTNWDEQPARFLRAGWQDFPTQSPLCGRNDGLSNKLDGITISGLRTESIKAYGNAVVPQVVYEIFKAISQYEKAERLSA